MSWAAKLPYLSKCNIARFPSNAAASCSGKFPSVSATRLREPKPGTTIKLLMLSSSSMAGLNGACENFHAQWVVRVDRGEQVIESSADN